MRRARGLLALLAASLALAVEAQPTRLRSTQLDEAIYAQVKKGFSGGVLIARGSAVVLDRGYGDGIGPDSLFWIASVAKQFAGHESDGAAYYFTRGNEDFGANALVYIYPKTGTVLVILSHAGDAPSGLSWSRELLKQLSPMLR